MVLPVLIVPETVLEAKNVPVSNKIHVPTGPDGVPGLLQHHHATQQRDVKLEHVTVVIQITARDQLNVAKMLLCQTYLAHNPPLNCPLSSAVPTQIHSVVSNRHGKNVAHVHQMTREEF